MPQRLQKVEWVQAGVDGEMAQQRLRYRLVQRRLPEEGAVQWRLRYVSLRRRLREGGVEQ